MSWGTYLQQIWEVGSSYRIFSAYHIWEEKAPA